MLAPHHREDAKLGEVRHPAEDREDAVVLGGGEAMLGDDFRRDGDGLVHRGVLER